MTPETIVAYRSRESRYRTASYVKDGRTAFCVAEGTGSGVLITEFDDNCGVLNQRLIRAKDAGSELEKYLSSTVEVGNGGYERVVAKTSCTECKGQVVREFDLREPKSIVEVPVVPIFVCTNCNKRFYSMTESYLRALVEGNPGLFESDELREKQENADVFINTLNEYIIRVFASKKIERLR